MGFRTIAAGVCALALALAARAEGPAPDRALVQLDWIPTGEHTAYVVDVPQFSVADLGTMLAARSRQDAPVAAGS
ncbi:hypothetical protein JYK14_12420 [Siccirubricoccus sp. KC 17139]|uniref:Uncharacterized protein n=1 Tax=Siccirubricoccus soli TaxID=2899147 RepID=A0ABT1D4V5_9PROT|nr:hypothetical protein [Siccirubricoccus soli]MCO6416958.1 hypothetical protein [Siccirubricoccus soli]MCP2683093.1 hypothetical protein [Siccirubricoccus soli]